MPAAARHALATMRSPPGERKYTTTIQSPPGKHHEIKNIQTRHKAITTRLAPPGTMQSFPGKHHTTTTIKARHQKINTRSPAPCAYHRASTMLSPPFKHPVNIMRSKPCQQVLAMRSPRCDRKYTTIIQSPPRKHHMIKNIQTRHKAITTRLSPPEHLAIITVQLSLNYQASTMRLPS